MYPPQCPVCGLYKNLELVRGKLQWYCKKRHRVVAIRTSGCRSTIDFRQKTSNNFRESFRQALRGETYPIETLWDGIDETPE